MRIARTIQNPHYSPPQAYPDLSGHGWTVPKRAGKRKVTEAQQAAEDDEAPWHGSCGLRFRDTAVVTEHNPRDTPEHTIYLVVGVRPKASDPGVARQLRLVHRLDLGEGVDVGDAVSVTRITAHTYKFYKWHPAKNVHQIRMGGSAHAPVPMGNVTEQWRSAWEDSVANRDPWVAALPAP